LTDKVKCNVHLADFFFEIAPHNGAMNYFDSAIDNDILSVHYQIGGCKNFRGSALILSAN